MSEVKLIHIDCMEFMKSVPDKYYDLAIVDPPYGLGLDMVTKVNSNARQERANGSVVKHEHKDWNNQIPSAEYFKELHRVTKHQIIWGCNYYAKYIPAVGRIIHDKQMEIEGTAFKWSEADIASCSMFKRLVMFRYQWQGNRQNGTINWFNTGPDARIHPTQKPISLYKYCLSLAKPGFKIFDSHLGSGSIAIACDELGFDLTACEIDKGYYDAAVTRFNNHKAQTKLFV
ncbi:MAG: site-specific DNA-methyltransferase [Candidatus Doudnabacteria bacterium]|nr:site-specific DNA-methyltransferase [Candidatus Doudnabacteria bacterium]